MLAEAQTGSYADFLAQARQRAAHEIEIETDLVARGRRPWGIYGTSTASMEVNTRRLLGMSYGDFFRERRSLGGKVYAMDVMGQGGFSGVDGEVAVTLVDFRTHEQREHDRRRNKLVLLGDVLDEKTWAPLDKIFDKKDDTDNPDVKQFIANLGDAQFPWFDLITCSPKNGWSVLKNGQWKKDPYALLTEGLLVNTMVRYLNPRQGVLSVEMSGTTPYGNWVRELNQTQGISANFYDNFVNITRTARVFGKLPQLA